MKEQFDKNFWWEYITNVYNTITMTDRQFDSFNYVWVISREVLEKILEDYDIKPTNESELMGIRVKVDESNTNGVRIFKELEYWNNKLRE